MDGRARGFLSVFTQIPPLRLIKLSWPVLISTLMPASGLLSPTSTSTALNAPSVPATRSSPTNWLARREGFATRAKSGGIDLLSVRYSITDGRRTHGSTVFPGNTELIQLNQWCRPFAYGICSRPF